MFPNALRIEEYNKICNFLDSQSLFQLEPNPRLWKFLPADVLYYGFVLHAEFWHSTPHALATVLQTTVERLHLVRSLVISFDGCDSPVSHSPYLDWLLNNLPNLECVQLRDSTRSFADDYLTFFHGRLPEPLMNDCYGANFRRASLKVLVWKSTIRMTDSFVRFLHTQPEMTRLEFNSLYSPTPDIVFHPEALPNLKVLHCSSDFSALLLPGRPISHLQVSLSSVVNPYTAMFPSCDDTDSVQVLSVGLDHYSINAFYEFVSRFRNLKTLAVIAPNILDLEKLYRLLAVISLSSPNIEFIRLCGPLLPQTFFPHYRIFAPLESLLAFEYPVDESSGIFRRLFRGSIYHQPPPIFVKWTCGLHNEWLGDWKTDAKQVEVDARHFTDVKSAVDGRSDRIISESACVAVKTTIRRLADKGFAWRLLHQDKIKQELATAETAIGDAMSMLNASFLGTHLSAQKLQVEIAAAQKADQRDLVARLEGLANNDRKILAALQADSRGRRRLEELILALDKHVKGITAMRDDPAEAFLRTASSALQRMSGHPAPEAPHWAVTGLEVTFDPDDEESCIGKGGFGNIYKGEWNGQVVAVKEMYSEDARLLDRNDLKPFIVTRFCANGNVLEYLRRNPAADRVVLLHEVSLGMTYLHSQGIIHADLKGVRTDSSLPSPSVFSIAVIADFGLSRLQDQIASATTRTKKASGTLRWMAPELLDAEPLDKPADVYSFALLAWELYTGLVPFGDLPERALARRVVDKRERPLRPGAMEDDVWGLVQQWWVHEASMRPVFGSIQTQLRGILLKGRTPSVSAVAAVAMPLDATYSASPNTNSPQSSASSDAPSALFESLNISSETAWTKVSKTTGSESRSYSDPWGSPTAAYTAKATRSPDEPSSGPSHWYPVATPTDPLPALPVKGRPDVLAENPAWQVYGRAAAVSDLPRSTRRNREPQASATYPIPTTATKTSPKTTPRLHAHVTNPEGTVGARDLLCVAIDNQWVAVGLASSEIRVYNAVTGASHAVLEGHKSGVWDVELASWDDMKYSGAAGGTNSILLSGGADRDIRVWDVETRTHLHSLQGHTSTVRSIKALAGRPRAVSGGRDRAAFVWDVKRGVWDTDYGIERHVLCGHTGRVYCVAIDGTRIVSGGEDKTVRVWDAKSGNCEVIISEHSGLVGQLQLSPTHVVSAGVDGLLIVYTFETSAVYAINAHDSSVVSLQLDPPHIISGSTDGTVKMWDLFSGKYIRHLGQPASTMMTSNSIVESFKVGMDRTDTDMIISCLAPDVLVVEHGPKSPELPFLGIEFHGHVGMKKYLDALSQSLKIHKFEYVELSASKAEDRDVVYVKGAGEFEYKETGKRWEETFISRFEIVKGRIVRYETWAVSVTKDEDVHSKSKAKDHSQLYRTHSRHTLPRGNDARGSIYRPLLFSGDKRGLHHDYTDNYISDLHITHRLEATVP
ncbi:hypothetical protein EYR36_009224 [Pleurotus pulmonarius]|nr:hypothetical protein EYR36_009224 [Pleurotus pulmonarius]